MNSSAKKPLLLFLFVLISAAGLSQITPLPDWFTTTYREKELDKKYGMASFHLPAFVQEDLNGDGVKDVAVLVIERATQKQGILVMHGNTHEVFVFGAGTNFGRGYDDFKWMSEWKIYSKKKAVETVLDKESGDMIGTQDVKLERPGILAGNYENGKLENGGIIYWNGQQYIWIQQGE